MPGGDPWNTRMDVRHACSNIANFPRSQNTRAQEGFLWVHSDVGCDMNGLLMRTSSQTYLLNSDDPYPPTKTRCWNAFELVYHSTKRTCNAAVERTSIRLRIDYALIENDLDSSPFVNVADILPPNCDRSPRLDVVGAQKRLKYRTLEPAPQARLLQP